MYTFCYLSLNDLLISKTVTEKNVTYIITNNKLKRRHLYVLYFFNVD